MALRHPDAVLAMLAELRPMANVGPVTLDEVREVLTRRLTFLRSEPLERRYGKVFVSTIPETAGMLFHTVFLPGLGEDLFPRKRFEDPLLLDANRKYISPNLAVQDQRVSEERLLLHTAAESAESKLWISYPRMNLGQGRSRGPSFYAIEVIRAATGRVPDLQQLQRVAAEASQSQPGWPVSEECRDRHRRCRIRSRDHPQADANACRRAPGSGKIPSFSKRDAGAIVTQPLVSLEPSLV